MPVIKALILCPGHFPRYAQVLHSSSTLQQASQASAVEQSICAGLYLGGLSSLLFAEQLGVTQFVVSALWMTTHRSCLYLRIDI